MMRRLAVARAGARGEIGTAGEPGVDRSTIAMVVEQVGVPVEGIAVIIGVDRLLDMVRTAVNVTGDSVVSLVVAHSEKQFDESVFLDPNADADANHGGTSDPDLSTPMA